MAQGHECSACSKRQLHATRRPICTLEACCACIAHARTAGAAHACTSVQCQRIARAGERAGARDAGGTVRVSDLPNRPLPRPQPQQAAWAAGASGLHIARSLTRPRGAPTEQGLVRALLARASAQGLAMPVVLCVYRTVRTAPCQGRSLSGPRGRLGRAICASPRLAHGVADSFAGAIYSRHANESVRSLLHPSWQDRSPARPCHTLSTQAGFCVPSARSVAAVHQVCILSYTGVATDQRVTSPRTVSATYRGVVPQHPQ